MKRVSKAEIYHNGKRLDLEVVEYKTLFKADVIDNSKWWSHCGTLRIKKWKGLTFNVVVGHFREMCINNKYF